MMIRRQVLAGGAYLLGCRGVQALVPVGRLTQTALESWGGALRRWNRKESRTRLLSTMPPASANTEAPAKSWVPGGLEVGYVGSFEEFEGGVVILPFLASEEPPELSGFAAAVDAATAGAVSELIAAEDFKGKAGSSAVVRLPKVRVAVLGLGDTAISAAVGKYVTEVSKTHKAATVGVGPVLGDATHLEAEALLTACLEATYVDNRFRTGDAVEKKAPLEKVVFFDDAVQAETKDAVEAATAVAAGVGVARDIVNAPANVLTPKTLAQLAVDLADEYPESLSCSVLSPAECEARKMGAFLGVAKGAAPEFQAQFIHLTYTGPGFSENDSPTLAMVGKGLTYDSGGINIKPSAGGMIEKMKFDCGGSAAVLGCAASLARLKLPNCKVHFIVAACENMVSANSMRPGDILTASNGRTIEVINTDAEGRLTLADALLYAESECKPDAIVDLATLTGAMIIALGENVAGLFTPHDAFADELAAAAKTGGEKIWRMPLDAGVDDQLKSKIADLKNVGGRPAGSITAALFLKEFVSKDLPWAHLDIAGPVWDTKADAATGFGVKTLVAFARARASSSSSESS